MVIHLQPQARRNERCSVMTDLCDRMTAEEFCKFFHEAHHLRDAEACLNLAELYRQCDQIEENVRCSLLWCCLARTFYSGSGRYDAFKNRSATLMRANMKELNDEEMKPVKYSLAVFGNLDFRLESAPGDPIAADPVESIADVIDAEEAVAGADGKVPERKEEKQSQVGILLCGHGGSDICLPAETWLAYLNAGSSFGWSPRGTTAYHKDEWSGSYFPPEWQTVEDDDARRLSMALDRMIDAVRSGEKMTDEQLEAVKEVEFLDKDLSGAQEVADYALEGLFVIGGLRDKADSSASKRRANPVSLRRSLEDII